MPAEPNRAADDRLTIIAIALLAYITDDILHEALGHGVTAWAHKLTLSTLALSSDIDTRWISANGTLANLIFGGIFWLLLRKGQHYPPAARYFFVLSMAGNLFSGTGYFLFSGVSNFGDWAAVIQGLNPHWLWRLGLVVIGAIAYYLSVLFVAAALRPFDSPDRPPRRIRILSWTPYITEGVLAGIAGLLNPLGIFYVISSGLASTLGANAGLWAIPAVIRRRMPPNSAEPVAPIPRSTPWIAVGASAALLFIVVLGRGITWTR